MSIECTKTKAGWAIAMNSVVAGETTGRRVLYRWQTLARLGLGKKAEPYDSDITGGLATNVEYLLARVGPDHVLAKGWQVR